MSFKRVAVAISGSGRSLRNLLERQETLSFKIVGVISSSPSCRGNDVAREFKIPLQVFNFSPQIMSSNIDAIAKCLAEWSSDGVVLAGFLKHWPTIEGWQRLVINIHPALLPKYGGPGMFGAHVHNAVISNRESQSGATVHLVDEIYDHGALVSQIRVPVLPADTSEELAKRVFAAECELLPRTIDKLAKSELALDGQRVWSYDFDQK
jgi:phosphoribosylglycinamide formyltransferase-1